MTVIGFAFAFPYFNDFILCSECSPPVRANHQERTQFWRVVSKRATICEVTFRSIRQVVVNVLLEAVGWRSNYETNCIFNCRSNLQRRRERQRSVRSKFQIHRPWLFCSTKRRNDLQPTADDRPNRGTERHHHARRTSGFNAYEAHLQRFTGDTNGNGFACESAATFSRSIVFTTATDGSPASFNHPAIRSRPTSSSGPANHCQRSSLSVVATVFCQPTVIRDPAIGCFANHRRSYFGSDLQPANSWRCLHLTS